MTRPISKGAVAGFLGGILGLVALFIAMVAYVAVESSWEIGAVLLTAATYIPLMLLFFAIPILVLAVSIGLVLGMAAKAFGRAPSGWVGILAGAVLGIAGLTFVLPLIFEPQPRDFTGILSNAYFASAYGGFIGWMASRVFSRSLGS